MHIYIPQKYAEKMDVLACNVRAYLRHVTKCVLRRESHDDWRRTEHVFLVLFLVLHTILFLRRSVTSLGFDTGAHLEMLSAISWFNTDIGIYELFYSYHPPLGFLLARTILLLGFHPVASVHIISFISSLIAFWFLRKTLQSMVILHRFVGICFLYITASIPLNIYLGSSVNLDIIVFAFASIVLWCSVGLFWNLERSSPQKRRTMGALLITCILCAMLTKFSGVLLLIIPCLIALLNPHLYFLPRYMVRAICCCTIAVACAFPYYFERYYVTQGTFFPSNTDTWMSQHIEKRDQDKSTYIQNMLLAPLVHADNTPLQDVSFEGARLFDMWKGFWGRSPWFDSQTPLAQKISIFYMYMMPILLLPALSFFLLYHRYVRMYWMQIGWFFLLNACIQIAALMHFVYTHPYAQWHPAKSIYVAPVLWTFGFLLATLFLQIRVLPRKQQHRHFLESFLLCSIALFMIVNHGVPVY